MNEGISYRLGILASWLKGLESEDGLIRLIKK